MAGIVRGSARTTPRVRAEFQASKETSGALAKRYGPRRSLQQRHHLRLLEHPPKLQPKPRHLPRSRPHQLPKRPRPEPRPLRPTHRNHRDTLQDPRTEPHAAKPAPTETAPPTAPFSGISQSPSGKLFIDCRVFGSSA
jgi:hypothetical protein